MVYYETFINEKNRKLPLSYKKIIICIQNVINVLLLINDVMNFKNYDCSVT